MKVKVAERMMEFPDKWVRHFQLPTDPDHLWDGLEDIGIGPRWIHEIRKNEIQLEVGGPKWDYKSYTVTFIAPDEDVVDGRVTLIGPDVSEVEPGTSMACGVESRLYGKTLTAAHREYIERRIAMSVYGVEGFIAIGAGDALWWRFNKKAAHKHSWAKLMQITYATLKTVVPMLERVSFTVVLGAPEVGGFELMKELHNWGSEKHKATHVQETYDDEDVDVFYGCTICKTLAPNHICVVTPSYTPYCGVMSYNGSRVTAELDPEGYVFPITPGKPLDTESGWYKGVDEAVYERSNHVIRHAHLYSSIKYPTTNCGCFEAASFYVPEVDGLAIAHRRYNGLTPLGIKFSRIAGNISGGAQNHGFKGLSMVCVTAKNFLRGDGGWNRIVWMPAELKKEIANAIPEEIYDKIATEEDTVDPVQLKEFLLKKDHPIVHKFWKDGKPQPLNLPAPGEDWPD